MSSWEKNPDFERVFKINRFVLGKIVLNLGGSDGYLQEYLKEKNKDKKIYSCDLKNSDFNADLNKIWNFNKKFDTLIAGELIEHIWDIELFASEACRHLNRGGRLIITTPNATGLNYLINPGWCVNYSNYEGHVHAFTIPMLTKILIRNGFNVVHEEYINAFWKRNPLKYISYVFKRLRPDIMIVAEKK